MRPALCSCCCCLRRARPAQRPQPCEAPAWLLAAAAAREASGPTLSAPPSSRLLLLQARLQRRARAAQVSRLCAAGCRAGCLLGSACAVRDLLRAPCCCCCCLCCARFALRRTWMPACAAAAREASGPTLSAPPSSRLLLLQARLQRRARAAQVSRLCAAGCRAGCLLGSACAVRDLLRAPCCCCCCLCCARPAQRLQPCEAPAVATCSEASSLGHPLPMSFPTALAAAAGVAAAGGPAATTASWEHNPARFPSAFPLLMQGRAATCRRALTGSRTKRRWRPGWDRVCWTPHLMVRIEGRGCRLGQCIRALACV